MTTRTLIVQKWTESERGWGVRPDGYTLHLTNADREAFIREYWARMPRNAPDEYSYPDGTPYTYEADARTYNEVKRSKNGIHKYTRPYPGSGGSDSWRSTDIWSRPPPLRD